MSTTTNDDLALAAQLDALHVSSISTSIGSRASISSGSGSDAHAVTASAPQDQAKAMSVATAHASSAALPVSAACKNEEDEGESGVSVTVQTCLDNFAKTVVDFLAALQHVARKDAGALALVADAHDKFVQHHSSPGKWKFTQRLAEEFHDTLTDVSARLQRGDVSAATAAGTISVLRAAGFSALYLKASAKVKKTTVRHLAAIATAAGACSTFAAMPDQIMAHVQRIAITATESIKTTGNVDFAAIFAQATAIMSATDASTQQAVANMVNGGGAQNLIAFIQQMSSGCDSSTQLPHLAKTAMAIERESRLVGRPAIGPSSTSSASDQTGAKAVSKRRR